MKPSGGKLWRLKYRHLGKVQQLSVGRDPALGPKDAQARRDEARKLIANGKNPTLEKKRGVVAASVGAANSFSAIAEELIAKRQREGLKDITTGNMRWLLSDPVRHATAVCDHRVRDDGEDSPLTGKRPDRFFGAAEPLVVRG